MKNSIEQFQGKIIYSLVSSAYFVDKSWGYGIPKGGMKLMYDIGRRHNIPVTFLITAKVAQEMQHMLTQFHHHGNACVGLMMDFPDQLSIDGHRTKGSDDIIAEMSVDQLRQYIRNEVDLIKKALPWAEVKVMGTGYRTEKLVQAAEAEGIIGMWGYCIFQIGTDNITDYGCPWGQFFIDNANYKAPSPKTKPGKVIGLEWTCRDISKAFHMAKSESYSTDPNDVESNGKCSATDVDYWVDLLREYRRNLQYNEMMFFLQHQESHEMENSEACVGFNKWRIDTTADMLDKFCAFVSAQPDVKCVTLNQACEIYTTKYLGITPPTYFYQQDIKIHAPGWKNAIEKNTADGSKHLWIGFHEKIYDYIDDYVKQSQFHFTEPPWHDSLFYFDTEVMFVFDQGVREPVWITDYHHPNGSRDEQFMWINSLPIKEIKEENKGNQKTITYLIESDRDRPYALFEWLNTGYGRWKVLTHSGEAKIFENAGIFIRIDLKPGKNEISMVLESQTY